MAGPQPLFDRALLDERRRRALLRFPPGADFLLETVAQDLVSRLAAVNRSFPLAVDLGSPLPLLAGLLVASGKVGRVVRVDRLPAAVAGTEHSAVAGDEQLLPFAPASLDLVVSALALQWTDDLPGALAQIRRALKPDGLFLAALLGGGTLSELRESLASAEAEITGGASPRVAPFVELREAGALLQRAGFALPVADRDRRVVRYASALELMRDLRAMGATNALLERDRRPLPRRVLARTVEIYGERFADPDGRVRATFEVMSLSGWTPDQSQQQALRPGSAKARLADALGAVERSAGEKAG